MLPMILTKKKIFINELIKLIKVFYYIIKLEKTSDTLKKYTILILADKSTKKFCYQPKKTDIFSVFLIYS